jgi:hypothetical protein
LIQYVPLFMRACIFGERPADRGGSISDESEGQRALDMNRNLDDLPIGQAIREVMKEARRAGRESLTAGELFNTISRYRVLSSRSNKPLSESKFPWRQFTIALGASPALHVEKVGQSISRSARTTQLR